MQEEDCPEAKKPCKGILKTSSSFDKPGAGYRKSAKFDELNVLQTLHPKDKDYGHMKIDEPKTPFNYIDPNEAGTDQLDAELLAEKLRIAANTQSPSFDAEENLSDEEFPEAEEDKVRRLEFERRRKAHYNEYEAVRLARKLIQEEIDDDEDDEVTLGDESSEKKSLEFQLYQAEEEGEAEEKSSIKTKSPSAISSESTSNINIALDRPMEIDQPTPCYGRDVE